VFLVYIDTGPNGISLQTVQIVKTTSAARPGPRC
jgi:hypothetical protein